MTRLGLRVTACLLTLVLAALLASTGGFGVAYAQPEGDTSGIRISIDNVTPDVVTATGPPTLTVSGTVENPGDNPFRDVDIRLQRSGGVTGADQLRAIAGLDPSQYAISGPFERISGELAPQGKATFSVTLPLRSAADDSLDLSEPGVYPLLLNVNGTDGDGTRLRLSTATFLLPVVGLPRTVTEGVAAEEEGAISLAPVAPEIDTPLRVTMLWPLADQPRIAAGTPGDGAPVRLVDDELASALAPGGHLEAALGAIEAATAPQSDPDRRTTNSVCLAVDPDLLLTVEAMTRGYLVTANPSDPGGPARAGSGTDAATVWLDRLRGVASRVCVLAVPFAQVDVEGLARLDRSALTARALADPTSIVGSILGVAPLADVTWPDAGLLSSGAAELVTTSPQSTALVAANTVAVGTSGSEPIRHARIAMPNEADPQRSLATVLFDASLNEVFAAVGGQPSEPGYTFTEEVTAQGRVARRQAALGELVWAALERNGNNPGTTDAPLTAPDLLIAPPQQWKLSADEATSILNAVATLNTAGLTVPQPLAETVAKAVAIPADQAGGLMQYPQRNEAVRVPDTILQQVADAYTKYRELAAALVEDPQSTVTPAQYLSPLRDDLVRSLSGSARRSASQQPAADRAATNRMEALQNTLRHLQKQVTVLNPGGDYTITSAQSRLLLVARNDLPVAINVRLRIEAPVGVKVEEMEVQRLPPRGYRQLSIPIEVSTARQFAVDAQLLTPELHPLGEPIRLSVKSSDYARIMTIVTACAAGLLFLLAGRRLWHRFRGQPDPADEGHEAR